jgi:alcohol dehydrogenase class IV
MSTGFRHHEHNRTVVFGPGALDSAGQLLPDQFTLLTTVRASSTQPALLGRASAVVEVPAGAIDVLAAELRDQVAGRPLVALGGGRIIDTAKAVAAAEGNTAVVAIPTTLSGAEMTRVHRHARGVADDVARVRPTLVINDPALSASLSPDQLAAGSANALAHAITAVISNRSTPVSRTIGADAIHRLGEAWKKPELDREAVALGALLAGWSVDLSGLGPHHALAQTVVRIASLTHAHANAALLPHTVSAFRRRAPERLARVDRDLESPLEDLTENLRRRAGVAGLGRIGGDRELLGRTVETAAGRAELERVPPAMSPEEIKAIYLAAAGATL